MPRGRSPPDSFRWFDSSPKMIRLVVMMYVNHPLSLRNVEDLWHERGIDVFHETVRLGWRRFGPIFATEIREKRVEAMRQQTHRRWHLDEVYVRIDEEMRYLWLAVDHEGEVLESFVTKEWHKAAALEFIKKVNRPGSVGGYLAVIDTTVAQREGWSPSCSGTIRTARSRTSSENLFIVLLVIAPSSQD